MKNRSGPLAREELYFRVSPLKGVNTVQNNNGQETQKVPEKTHRSLKFKIGMFFIVLGVIIPAGSLIIPFLGLPATVSATLIGITLIGGPDIALIVGAALAGKEAVEMVKSRIKDLFRRKGTPKPVGKRRYHFGLVLLLIGFLIPILTDYLPHLTGIHVSETTELYLHLTGDSLVLISFFVLGHQFLTKLGRLITWEPQNNNA
jgi:hypothetical protein